MSRFLAVFSLALLAACAGPGTPVRITGAESGTAGGQALRTSVVPAALTPRGDDAMMELVAADGAVFTGLLRKQVEPVIVPLSALAAPPLVGGGTKLTGDILGANGAMSCSFRLLNPPRGVDGGGSGRCDGAGRQVEFVF
jgi:hypothetical protein